MPQLELRTDISASREAVWPLLLDFEQEVDWLSLAEKVTVPSEGPREEGFEFSESGKGSMFSYRVVWRVTECTPNRRLTLEANDGKVDMVRTYDLIETANGTRLFIRARYEAAKWMNPIIWVIWISHFRRRLSRLLGESLKHVKERIESTGSAA